MKGIFWIFRKLDKNNLYVLYEIYICIYIFMNNFYVIVNIYIRVLYIQYMYSII